MRKPNPIINPLFARIRDMTFRMPKDAPEFKLWLKVKYPDLTFHHVAASKFGRKSTDWLGTMVPMLEHSMNQHNREWLEGEVVPAIENLIKYSIETTQNLQRILELLNAKDKKIDELYKTIRQLKK